MSVAGLDHVNIRARSLDESVAFYRDALGLAYMLPPAELDPRRFAWLSDAAGHALIHLTLATAAGGDGAGGAIDHVALDCSGHAEVIERLEAMNLAFRRNRLASVDLEQVFVTDPNGVRLELNFRSGRH